MASHFLMRECDHLTGEVGEGLWRLGRSPPPPPPQPQSVFGKRPAHCIILPFMPREGEGEGRCGVAEAGACFFRQPCPPEPRARL